MTRSRTSAKQAGARFERQIADYLAAHVDDRIDRRARNGAKDRGDLTGLRIHGQRLVAELKDRTRVDLAGALTEAELERGNDDALAAVVIYKRHGRGNPADQLVTLTVRDLAALLTGTRPDDTGADLKGTPE
jgi:hypothetical protein